MTKKSYSFKTQKGADINITIGIEHTTTETHNFDGVEITKACNFWFYTVEALTINGVEHKGYKYNAAWHVQFGQQGKQPLLVALPQNVIDDIMSAEREYYTTVISPKNVAAAKVEADYQAHVNAVKKAMAE